MTQMKGVHLASPTTQQVAEIVTSEQVTTNLIFSVTSAKRDAAEWDAFLARTAGGSYVQSSLWAQSKLILGWQSVLVIARNHTGLIQGGVQLLLKTFPVAGSIAVAYRGPVVANPNPRLLSGLLAEVHWTAKQRRIQYLTIQPPEGGEAMVEQLLRLGYERGQEGWGHPPVTTVIDLTHDTELIAQRMRKSARYQLRRARRDGVSVREGTEADVSLFHRLLESTGVRQGFATHSESVYLRHWRIFAPGGHLKIFVAECEGEPVSAMLAICFADTVSCWAGAWSGKHKERHPNTLLHWEAINWAKAMGYRRYDFCGLDSTQELAFKVATGRMLLGEARSVNTLKLNFGGDVICSPMAYEYVPNPALRQLYRHLWRNERLQQLKERVSPILRGMGRR